MAPQTRSERMAQAKHNHRRAIHDLIYDIERRPLSERTKDVLETETALIAAALSLTEGPQRFDQLQHAFNAGYIAASQAIRLGTINDAWQRYISSTLPRDLVPEGPPDDTAGEDARCDTERGSRG